MITIIIYIKIDPDPWYKSCPNKNCKKKVIENSPGVYTCEKCSQDFDVVRFESDKLNNIQL